MADLYQKFSLPSERSIEILKNSNPQEYIIHKENQREARWEKGKIIKPDTFVTSEFPEWHVVFDRNQKLLRVYKPKYQRQ